ncbi:hypothetical protein [Roseiconus lacunae]|nr:hypothetical protein [Roseiconus lacunae]MCD0458600.1 hypothetical protein [Roseiconus lacunae]
MNRSARLQSAEVWLEKFDGKHVLRGYCKHFGVDWRCAAIELRQLGVKLDAEYLEARERSEQQQIFNRKQRRRERDPELRCQNSIEGETLLDAYLAGDFPALHAMECERDGVEPKFQR